MADTLTQSLDALSLNRDEPDSLPFTPHNHDAWLTGTFDQVPRYLFRVSFGDKSDGETTNIWAKSKYAKDGTPGQEIDILKGDRTEMARMLNSHLRWKRGSSSNLLSWTSSLLFALQYVLYRYHQDRVPLKDITLFIVDTTKLPRGAFVRDMDLITVFREFNDELRWMEKLRTEFRTSKDSEFGYCYYFGEYLSQGALKIEGKCSFTTAQNIIDMGLFDLMPEFIASFEKDLGWATRVVKLRGCFGQNPVERDIARDLIFAIRIGKLFGPGWQLPVAASLMGLQHRSGEDVDVICEELIKDATGWEPLLVETTIYLPFNSLRMPEVSQFNAIMSALDGPLRLKYMLVKIRKASRLLLEARQHSSLLHFSVNTKHGTGRKIGSNLHNIATWNCILQKDFPCPCPE